MQIVGDIKTVHIELTDKCQAQCPMCARNFNGGKVRPFIKNSEISFDKFKTWFPKEFLSQLNNFYSCGNYGDPAFAKDCLEIYSYVRDCNPATRLALHTNGGMRNADWWKKLATVIGKINQSCVVFGIDGFSGKHELYRRNTKFEKVIENMTAFIDAGGRARVDSLVFEHNQDDTEQLETFLKNLGVEDVKFISTSRFYNMNEFPVHDQDGNIEYFLKPASREQFLKPINVSMDSLILERNLKQLMSEAVINPACKKDQSIYVDPYGNVFPCCWLGSDFIEEFIEENEPIQQLRNKAVNSGKKLISDINIINLNEENITDIFSLFDGLEKNWNSEYKCLTCVKSCSSSIYDTRK